MTRDLKYTDHESDGDTNHNWNTRNRPPRFIQWTGRVRNWRINGDHPRYNIKISEKTEKKSRELRRIAFTQTSVKDHLISLVREKPQKN